MIQNIVNINKTITKDYFERYQYPWDVLNNLNNIINEIDKSNYTEIKPNKKKKKNIKIATSAEIIGPCIIDDNSEIKHCAYIRENVIIGKNCNKAF